MKHHRILKWLIAAHMVLFAPHLPGVETSSSNPPDLRFAWFTPRLVENHSPVCDEVMEDAQRFFVSDQSMYQHYIPRTHMGEMFVAGMQGMARPYQSTEVTVAGKTLYLQNISHPGCGGACETYQVVASEKLQPTYTELHSSAERSPPLASAYGLFEGKGGSIWLLIADDDELMVYQLEDADSWMLSCKVSFRPDLAAATDPAMQAAWKALADLKLAVRGLTRGSGSCGSMRTAGRWWNSFSDTLPMTLYRPWALKEAAPPAWATDDRYASDIEGLADWSLTGISEYAAFTGYQAQLEKTVNAVAQFYQATFKWSREESERMARTALTATVSSTIRFYMYDPFGSEAERALHKAILEGQPLNAIAALAIDSSMFGKDGEESLLSLAVGRPEVLDYLIKKGANPNHQNAFGKTPLMYAVQNNSLRSVTLLLEAGADVNARTYRPVDRCNYTLTTFGVTPLHYAVRYASPDVIRELLDQGAAPYLEAEKFSERTKASDWLERYTGADAEERNLNIPEERIAQVHDWLAMGPADTNALVADLVRDAEEAYMRKKLLESYKALNLALALDPKNERALSDMSLIALKNNKPGESLRASEKLIAMASSDKLKANAWFNQGLACQGVRYLPFDGRHYCTSGSIYPFYRAYKTEPTPARKAKLLETLVSSPVRYCDIPARGIQIDFGSGKDPTSNRYRHMFNLYVIHGKESQISSENLAWTVRYADGQEKLVIPEKLDSFDLGSSMLSVFTADTPTPKPYKPFGFSCPEELSRPTPRQQ